MGEVRFMISEAAKKVRVESHVLRYWEEELNLEIGRTEMGHRYYTKDDVQLFRCIKKLKDEGMLLKDLKPLIPELKETRLRLKQSATVSAQQNEAYVHSKATERKTGTSLKAAANLTRAAARHGISFSESSKISEGQAAAKPETVSADLTQTPAGQKPPRDVPSPKAAANKTGCAEMEPKQTIAGQIAPYTVVTQSSGANSAKKALHWGMAQSAKGQKAAPANLTQTDKGQKAPLPDAPHTGKQKASQPALTETFKGLTAAGNAQEGTASTPRQKAGQKDSASLSVAHKSDVVPATQLDQVRTLIGDVLTEVVASNNEALKKDISKTVTRDIMREMDFLFQARERQEEEHFRKLDCLIRQQQAHRRESAREPPMGRLKKLLT